MKTQIWAADVFCYKAGHFRWIAQPGKGFPRVANYCSEVPPFSENHSILDHWPLVAIIYWSSVWSELLLRRSCRAETIYCDHLLPTNTDANRQKSRTNKLYQSYKGSLRQELVAAQDTEVASVINLSHLRALGHLVPDSWSCLNTFRGSLQLPPAVPLPLLAQLSPRVCSLLEQKQEAAAAQVDEHWRKPRY